MSYTRVMIPFLLAMLSSLTFAADCPGQLIEYSRPMSWIKPVTAPIPHAYERRGLVEVPLDYTHPTTSPRINIFYRLLPLAGKTLAESASAPILVVMNGGPGYGSEESYRRLDFDYAHPEGQDLERLELLPKAYRVLLIDQRGTEGFSAPLDLNKPDLDATLISEYFGANQHALDHAAVIAEVVGSNEAFYLLGQSYGGIIAATYAVEAARGTVPRPKGIIFSSSALPNDTNFFETSMDRRRAQLKMNQQLARVVPEFPALSRALRGRVDALVPNSDLVDSLSQEFVSGAAPGWEHDVTERVRQMLALDDEALKTLADKEGETLFLNYILSSATMVPGFTDRTLARMDREFLPFEDWMLDEAAYYVNMRLDSPVQREVLARMDLSPPPPIKFPTNAEIKAALATTRVLFSVADDDAAVPAESLLGAIAAIAPENAAVVRLPHGHGAIFLEDGLRTLLAHGFY